jgi:hypothetical protein
MKNNEMLSLYEYLGKPAGSELGKSVAIAAMSHGAHIEERFVETRNYSGKILMYPRQFLDAYFNNKLPKPINVIEL